MNFVTQAKLAIKNFIKYLPLLQNLIARELKNKYRQSVLGYVWCVLNPLLVILFYGETIGVFAVVGSIIVVAGVVAYNVLKIKME